MTIDEAISFIRKAKISPEISGHLIYIDDNSYEVLIIYEDWNWSSNIYSVSEWTTMEENGAVFLPCTGYRHVKEVKNAELVGGYWASTRGSWGVGGISFDKSNAKAFLGGYDGSYAAADGHAVRLVQDVK